MEAFEGRHECRPRRPSQNGPKRALPRSGCVSSARKFAGKASRYLRVAAAFPDCFPHLNIRQSLLAFRLQLGINSIFDSAMFELKEVLFYEKA